MEHKCWFDNIDCYFASKYYLDGNQVKATCLYCQITCINTIKNWKPISQQQYEKYIVLK